MVHQLQLWREGIRDDDAKNVMSTIASTMTGADMRAVSDYYARVLPEGDAIVDLPDTSVSTIVLE